MKRAKDLLAVLACTCLVLSMLPAVALAGDDDTVTGTVDCGDGWTLAYSITDDEATITGVDAQPAEATDLTIPDTVGDADAPVTTIGTYVFSECAVLGAVDLPANLVGIEEHAFVDSSVTSICLPAGFEYVEANGFSGCTSLASLTFAEGCHPEYFAQYAFRNCKALKKLAIPALQGTAHESQWSSSGRLASASFYACTGLEEVSFLAGNEDGISSYGSINSAFTESGSNIVYVIYAKSSSLNLFAAEEGNVYYAVNFYDSQEEAEADTTGLEPSEQLVLSTGIYFTDLMDGKFGDYGYTGKEELPEMPEASREAGMVWGIPDHTFAMTCNYLSSTIDVYPVSPSDIDYARVTSDEIEAYYADSMNGNYGGMPQKHYNSHYHRLRSNGTVDLSSMCVKTAESTIVDPDEYTLTYEKQVSGGTGGIDASFQPIDSVDDINAAGTYRVQAHGVGDYEGTETAKAEFHVLRYDGDVYTYMDEGTVQNLGGIVKATADTKNASDRYAVLAPADCWQYSLIATALAGAGDAIAVYTNGSATADATFQALLNYSHATFIGPISNFGFDVIDRVQVIMGDDGAYNYIEDADYEALALDVFETVREFGPDSDEPYDWGDTAIVCAQSGCFDTALISQYAYQAHAPVFFTAADGSLGAKTREALVAGDFNKIVIAGDTDYVSASVAADVETATGIVPKRLLENGESACAESITFAEALQEEFTDADGTPVNSTKSTVVASVTDPATVFAAAELAALTGGVVLQCASSADVKAVEGYLLKDGIPGTDKIKSLYLCGDYSVFDTGVADRITSIWEVTPQDMTVGVGDTVEQDGVLYKITSGTAVTATTLLDQNRTALNIGTVSCSVGSYSVTALAAGAFANATSLKSVSLPGSITSIPARAFFGCTALSSISTSATQIGTSAFQNCRTLKTSPSSARTIGASAFQSCTSLVSVPAQATSIGTSAFQGCTALKSVSCASAQSIGSSAFSGCTSLSSVKLAKVTSIPASTFSGDKKLKTATFGAVKTIGASAFSGCAVLTTAPTAKAASIGASAFSGCTSLKTVKASSVKKIGASAFKGAKKLKTAKLTSKKLKSIGKLAFKGCKKLKKVTIKSKKLKNVGKKAFKGVGKKATVKVPKAKVKKYTKLLTKAGLSKKATVTA